MSTPKQGPVYLSAVWLQNLISPRLFIKNTLTFPTTLGGKSGSKKNQNPSCQTRTPPPKEKASSQAHGSPRILEDQFKILPVREAHTSVSSDMCLFCLFGFIFAVVLQEASQIWRGDLSLYKPRLPKFLECRQIPLPVFLELGLRCLPHQTRWSRSYISLESLLWVIYGVFF